MTGKIIKIGVVIVVVAAFIAARGCRARATGAAEPGYDVVIRNAHIVDGTGSPWYSGDIAIRDGRIAAIGRLGDVAAKTTIDAHGRVVAPGFIDMLGQSERSILVDPRLPSKIYQGITTEVTGEGSSIAPQTDATDQGRSHRLRALQNHGGLAHAFRNISRGLRSRGWASISRATWARRKCGVW